MGIEEWNNKWGGGCVHVGGQEGEVGETVAWGIELKKTSTVGGGEGQGGGGVRSQTNIARHYSAHPVLFRINSLSEAE